MPVLILFGQAGFPGCFLLKQKSEIIPVEPGQGNACEGKVIIKTFLISIPSLFLTLKT